MFYSIKGEDLALMRTAFLPPLLEHLRRKADWREQHATV